MIGGFSRGVLLGCPRYVLVVLTMCVVHCAVVWVDGDLAGVCWLWVVVVWCGGWCGWGLFLFWVVGVF